MKPLVIFAFILHLSSPHVIPTGVTIGLTPYSHPVNSLYHSQDNYGQYVYGYSTPTSTKSETKTADGVTRGGYSYIDTNGILQTVQYISDAFNGFRVAATNLPRDLPEVALAKAQHLAEYAAIASANSNLVKYTNPVVVPMRLQPVQDLPEVVNARNQHLAILNAAYATGIAPQPVQDLPEVIKARSEHLAAVEATKARNAAINLSPIPQDISGAGVIPVKTVYSSTNLGNFAPPTSSIVQYRSQDNSGQYSYGYIGPLSSKSEVRSSDGVTRGGYSYIDANGILQTVNYISDDVNGFRVAATNLPVASRTTLVAPGSLTVQQIPTKLYTQQIIY